jgi:hypothetical protein
MVPVLPALFAATMTIAVADQVPSLNIQPGCKAQADGIIGLKQDVEVCLKSEAGVRAQLEQQWSQFAAADRTSCTRLTTMSGGGSYTELLTCLEMKRDARKLPAEGTVGQVAR